MNSKQRSDNDENSYRQAQVTEAGGEIPLHCRADELRIEKDGRRSKRGKMFFNTSFIGRNCGAY